MPDLPNNVTVPDWDKWHPDIEATLVFIHQGSRVLLIEKLRGIGMGKINGPGGKIDPGETPLECAVREVQEELHIDTLDPVKRGELWFAMSDLPDIHCHVYTATKFTGTPTATDEAIPYWCEIADIPFEKMWEDDSYWLPQALKGETFDARFTFENEKIQHDDVLFGEASAKRWRKEQS
ncbi:8-oxo-dGTP diphosphatase [Akkermansiaceae bacterium]|nr:8-oxo-dGTP diphosphatase [Akkermansiaceae bacterium]MDB4287028.1 8-oxo-dGTP diphosphatase [Akkermansiaceae bacterium]